MGRGDRRTRRGKVAAGSFGKFRLKNKNKPKKKQEK
ncbi:30S ribosomal protein THX [Candidatus Uabimicrobium sp. HlEnr_7]